jgi:hypothetical protein
MRAFMRVEPIAIALLLAVSPLFAADRKPNVLVILCDDTG